jgi:hypothetical protein
MPSTVVFDVESDVLFQKCAGADRNQKLKVMQATVACAFVLDSELCLSAADAQQALAQAEKRHFWADQQEHGQDAFEPLLRLFDDAECIVAYNGLDFDLPLMRKHYGCRPGASDRYFSHRFKTHDPFATLRSHTELWPKLDTLLAANELQAKLGDGKQAVTMWNQGRRDELQRYCYADVAALAALCLKPHLHMPGVGRLPNRLFGIASALAAVRAVSAPDADPATGDSHQVRPAPPLYDLHRRPPPRPLRRALLFRTVAKFRDGAAARCNFSSEVGLDSVCERLVHLLAARCAALGHVDPLLQLPEEQVVVQQPLLVCRDARPLNGPLAVRVRRLADYLDDVLQFIRVVRVHHLLVELHLFERCHGADLGRLAPDLIPVGARRQLGHVVAHVPVLAFHSVHPLFQVTV